jgi:hypothetical protein
MIADLPEQNIHDLRVRCAWKTNIPATSSNFSE